MSVFYPRQVARADFKINFSPTNYHWDLDPGGIINDTLTMTNPSDQTLKISLSVFRFDVPDDQEDASPVVDESNPNPYQNKVTLETSPSQFQLAKGEERNIKVRLKAATDAHPGTYQLAIQALISSTSSKPIDQPNEKQPIVVGQETLTKLSVPAVILVGGKTNLAGQIESLVTDKNIYTNGPVVFTLKFRNTGDVHYQAKATIFIFKDGAMLTQFDVEQKTILPNRRRSITYKWEKIFLDSGNYEARAVVSYGTNYQKSANTRTVFRVVPTAVAVWALPALGGLAGIFILLTLLGRRRRKRRR